MLVMPRGGRDKPSLLRRDKDEEFEDRWMRIEEKSRKGGKEGTAVRKLAPLKLT